MKGDYRPLVSYSHGPEVGGRSGIPESEQAYPHFIAVSFAPPVSVSLGICCGVGVPFLLRPECTCTSL